MLAVGVFFTICLAFIQFLHFPEFVRSILNARQADKAGMTALRVALLLIVVWGAYETVATVFNAADASMGLMATINLVAIVLLSGVVVKLTRDYFAKKKSGAVPHFDAQEMPELKGEIDAEIWRNRTD